MIRSLPNTKRYLIGFNVYIVLFYAILFIPLIVVSILAFNDSSFTSLPWKGFTLDWFFGEGPEKIGLFHDGRNLKGIFSSLKVAATVMIVTTVIGTLAAFLIEHEEFRFKKIVYFLVIAPLVVPGVIIGISILSSYNLVGFFLEEKFNLDLAFFSPGYTLVVLGQSTFITPFVFLVILARLKKFDRSLEEAAYNLGASRFEVIWHITLRYLRPAHIAGAVVALILSFDNFNTTLFLVGSDPTMPIVLFTQVRDGSTPVVNAVSFLIIIFFSFLAFINFIASKEASKSE